MFANFCGIIATVLTLVAAVPYIRSVLRGKTQPHQFSWLIFSIMGGVTLVSQLLAGARASALLFLAYFVAQVVIFILSLKYGVRSTSRFDYLLLALSLLTIALYVVTRSNALAIWLTALIDIPATAMTILKLRHHPSSEALFPWVFGTLAAAFGCFALAGTTFGILYVRPLYALASEAAVAGAIYWYGSVARHKQSGSQNSSEIGPIIP